ncbi:hypothetical protein [Desertimonas flava]|uniref:hypothetical protein n=1 Tax=Desertimonas flava TaxID=2064846 RepID=UPI0013C403E1|nr:hypothetical protein [Desertimonas flava]
MDRPSDPPAAPATARRLHALDAIRSWPGESRRPASWLIHVHHEPNRVSERELVWERVEPWERIVAARDFEEREWPVPHAASVRSAIRYHVPADRRAAVDELDLGLVVDDDGLVEVVGPDLRTNLLALNLMHDVVTGVLAPGDARRRYADVTTTAPDGPPHADLVKCRFDDVTPLEPGAVPPSDPQPVPPAGASAPSGSVPSTASPIVGVHEAMPTPPPDSDPTSNRDTDQVNERRMTRRHGHDVDEAAERSSGFDLDDDRSGDDAGDRQASPGEAPA